MEPIKLINNFCIECQMEMRILNFYYTCPCCGITNNSFIFDIEETEPSKVTYTRLNHLKFKLNKLNAKDCDYIPPKVIKLLEKEEFKSIQELRTVMKKHKLGFYYKNVHYIYLIIKKEPILVITDEFQLIIYDHFIKICENYFNCEKKRIQFINYNYFIFKICCMYKKYNYAKHIPFISKHKRTIRSYDKTFKAICNKLKWKFTSTFDELKIIYSSPTKH